MVPVTTNQLLKKTNGNPHFLGEILRCARQAHGGRVFHRKDQLGLDLATVRGLEYEGYFHQENGVYPRTVN